MLTKQTSVCHEKLGRQQVGTVILFLLQVASLLQHLLNLSSLKLALLRDPRPCAHVATKLIKR